MSKVICIRCDANPTLGVGHLMRCLTLAKSLHKITNNIIFIMKGVDQGWCEHIRKNNFSCVNITSENEGINLIAALSPFAVIIDHYGLDAQYHRQLRPFTPRLLVIDDLANRLLRCDILLDQNFRDDAAGDYEAVLNPEAVILSGPKFSLLRDEFSNARKSVSVRTLPIKKIFVFFGGGDHAGMTLKTLKGLLDMTEAFDVCAVVGHMNPEKDKVKSVCEQAGWSYYEDVSFIASLMSEADLAIGAGGTTILERAALGLPALVVTIADNQLLPTQKAAELGIVCDLGKAQDFSLLKLREAIYALQSEKKFSEMSQKALDLVPVDGAEKVAKKLALIKETSYSTYLRDLEEKDAEMVLGWRNSEFVRKNMHNSDVIPYQNHIKWVSKILSDDVNFDYSIFVYEDEPVGLIGFYKFNEGQTSCEWGFYLGKSDLPAGTGAIMTRLGINHIFQKRPKLVEIYGEALKSNPQSIGLHKKLGFKRVQTYDVPKSNIEPFSLTRENWQMIGI